MPHYTNLVQVHNLCTQCCSLRQLKYVVHDRIALHLNTVHGPCMEFAWTACTVHQPALTWLLSWAHTAGVIAFWIAWDMLLGEMSAACDAKLLVAVRCALAKLRHQRCNIFCCLYCRISRVGRQRHFMLMLLIKSTLQFVTPKRRLYAAVKSSVSCRLYRHLYCTHT